MGTLRTALRVASLTIGLLGAGSTVALAQLQEGLVNVNIEDVKLDIAKDINVDVSQIPVTVQAPISVAADVCNVAVDVLTADLAQDQLANCRAQSTNTALNGIVQEQLGVQQ